MIRDKFQEAIIDNVPVMKDIKLHTLVTVVDSSNFLQLWESKQACGYTRVHCHSSLLFAPLIGIIHMNEDGRGIMTEGPRPSRPSTSGRTSARTSTTRAAPS